MSIQIHRIFNNIKQIIVMLQQQPGILSLEYV
jgi:hypothetical protein